MSEIDGRTITLTHEVSVSVGDDRHHSCIHEINHEVELEHIIERLVEDHDDDTSLDFIMALDERHGDLEFSMRLLMRLGDAIATEYKDKSEQMMALLNQFKELADAADGEAFESLAKECVPISPLPKFDKGKDGVLTPAF